MRGVQLACFRICFLTNFNDSGHVETSHLPYKEISIIIRIALGLEGIVVIIIER